MVELKECCMSLSNIKRLWLQTRSSDTDNNLLARTTWCQPERHAGTGRDCTPFSLGYVLTTFNAKLPFTETQLLQMNQYYHKNILLKTKQPLCRNTKIDHKYTSFEQKWWRCSWCNSTWTYKHVHSTVLWHATNLGLVDKHVIWSESNDLCQAAAS